GGRGEVAVPTKGPLRSCLAGELSAQVVPEAAPARAHRRRERGELRSDGPLGISHLHASPDADPAAAGSPRAVPASPGSGGGLRPERRDPPKPRLRRPQRGARAIGSGGEHAATAEAGATGPRQGGRSRSVRTPESAQLRGLRRRVEACGLWDPGGGRRTPAAVSRGTRALRRVAGDEPGWTAAPSSGRQFHPATRRAGDPKAQVSTYFPAWIHS